METLWRSLGIIGDAIWLQIGGGEWNSREEQLNRCLVGRWEQGEGCHTDVAILRKWGKFQWKLKGELSIKNLMAVSFMLEFEFPKEAKRVLKRGVGRVENNLLLVEKWTPYSVCFKVETKAIKVWVRAARLPLNLWNHRMFKRIGDCCGGLVVVDSDRENFTHL